MTFNDLEKKVVEINSVPFNEICVWYKIVNNPKSTTRQDIHQAHKLYDCYASCDGRLNGKDCYRIIEQQDKYMSSDKLKQTIKEKTDKAYVRFMLGDMVADPEYKSITPP